MNDRDRPQMPEDVRRHLERIREHQEELKRLLVDAIRIADEELSRRSNQDR